MKCLNCDNDSSTSVCDPCSEELFDNFDRVLDRASKKVVEADHLEITKDGTLILVTDESLTCINFSTEEWRSIRDYIATTHLRDEDD